MSERSEHDRILKKAEVAKIAGFSVRTLYNEMSAGRFPKPIQISVRRVGWRASDIEAWAESRNQGRHLSSIVPKFEEPAIETMRDRFAMAALTAHMNGQGLWDDRRHAEIASWAFELADAMIAARRRNGRKVKELATDDLISACREAGARLRYSGDLFHDQGLHDRAHADWEASKACYAALAKAQVLE